MLFLRGGHFVSWESFTETWSLLFRLDSLSSRSPGSTCCHPSWQRNMYYDPFVSDMSSALELGSSCLQRPGLSFPAPLFVFICQLALRQFHFVSQAGLTLVMFLPLPPESGIRYRYTKPYQTLLSIFCFPCWDRAAPSSGLVWLKCKCSILLWVICRFYLIPQKLSSLRTIALPPRLL